MLFVGDPTGREGVSGVCRGVARVMCDRREWRYLSCEVDEGLLETENMAEAALVI